MALHRLPILIQGLLSKAAFNPFLQICLCKFGSCCSKISEPVVLKEGGESGQRLSVCLRGSYAVNLAVVFPVMARLPERKAIADGVSCLAFG